MKSKKLIKSITKYSISFLVLALICISTTFVQAQPTAGSTGIGFVDHAANLDSVPSGYVSFYSDNANIFIGHRPYDSQVSQIKASSPNTLCFAYKLQVRKEDDGTDNLYHGIGSFNYVASQGESWFLHYNDGNPPSENNRVTDPLPGNAGRTFWYNIGNPAVQTYVANTLVNELADLSWDGVFLDCIYMFENAGIPRLGGQAIQEYSTGSAWNTALYGWVQAIYDAFNTYNASHSHKLYVILNTTGVWQKSSDISNMAKAYNNVCYAQLWEDFVGLYFWKPAERYLNETRWNTQIEVAEDAASKGTGIFAFSHYKSDVPADSRHDMIYGKGSLMLVTDGNAQKFVLSARRRLSFDENNSVYNSFSDIFRYDIGTPTGSRYQSNGVWQRDFSGGKVVVNPTSSDQGILELGRSYTDFATGNTVTSISLTANTAWLLASQGVAPTPTPIPDIAYSLTAGGNALDDGGTFEDYLPLTFEILDDLSGVASASITIDDTEYSIDLQAGAGIDIDLAGKTGSHTATVSIEGTAGNITEEDVTFTVTTSLDSMEQLIDRYSGSGELENPLLNKLASDLEQARQQLENGHVDQTVNKLNKFIEDLNKNNMQNYISENAKAALWADAQTLIDINIDNAAPSYKLTVNGNILDEGGTFEDYLPLTFEAWDDLSGMTYAKITIDGMEYSIKYKKNTSVDIDLAGQLGTHTAVITAEDNAGNSIEETFTFTVTTSLDSLMQLIERYCKEGHSKDVLETDIRTLIDMYSEQ